MIPSAARPVHKKNKKCFRAPPRSFQRGIWAKKTLTNCKLQVSRSGRPLGGPLGNPYRWPGWSRFQRARGKRTGNAKSSGTAVEPLGVDLIFHVFGLSFQRGIWAKKTLKNCKLQVSRSGRPLGGPLGNPYRWPGWSRFQRARGKRTGNAKSSGTAVEPLGVDLIFHVFGARRRSRW